MSYKQAARLSVPTDISQEAIEFGHVKSQSGVSVIEDYKRFGDVPSWLASQLFSSYQPHDAFTDLKAKLKFLLAITPKGPKGVKLSIAELFKVFFVQMQVSYRRRTLRKCLIGDFGSDSLRLLELVIECTDIDLYDLTRCCKTVGSQTDGCSTFCDIEKDFGAFHDTIVVRPDIIYELIHRKLFPLEQMKHYQFYLFVHDAYKRLLVDSVSPIIGVKVLTDLILEY